MEQITAMKIDAITFENFRNHTAPQTYAFGNISYISGHNGTGKTTMAHGIAYALYGVSYYGEQKIARLMNEEADGIAVQLDFTDQNGTSHSLVRARRGDKTSLLLDSYTVRQTDIDRMFCDKDTFLSMFNPTYLTEMLGTDGRELILKHLKPIRADSVLESLSESYRKALESVNFSKAAPDVLLKSYRENIRQIERQLTMLEGHLDSVRETQSTADVKLNELYAEKRTADGKLSELNKRQFDGIDRDDLAIQRDVLIEKLAEEPTADDEKLNKMRLLIERIRQKPYESKYLPAGAQLQAEIGTLSKQHKTLAQRIRNLQPGTKCPTCMTPVTEHNLSDIKNNMLSELNRIKEQGQTLISQRAELNELAAKEKAVFEQFKADDIAKLQTEIAALEQQTAALPSRKDIRQKIDALEEALRVGNLSDEELGEQKYVEAELIGIDAQIKALNEACDEARVKELLAKKTTLEEDMKQTREIISALIKYVAKRTELAVADLQMPNVKIKLFDIVRSTGELVNVFRFTYKDRDYASLSLSEKTLAGIEVAAMVRKITGIDCPICIDNTESIAAFNPVSMPSQSLLLRFVKNQALTVQSRGQAPVQELRKAS